MLIWAAEGEQRRGRAVLVHGFTSSAETWWRIGPALASRGWDVVAVDLPGHGSRALVQPPTLEVLAESVVADVARPPTLLVGHSLGALVVLEILRTRPGWAATVVLEDPPASVFDEQADVLRLAESVEAGAAAVRADRVSFLSDLVGGSPRWAQADREHAADGLAGTADGPYAAWLRSSDPRRSPFRSDTADLILSTAPTPFVLVAGDRTRSFFEGGSAVSDPDRAVLQRSLPADHWIGIDGGHALHRDDPDGWLAAVDRILWLLPPANVARRAPT